MRNILITAKPGETPTDIIHAICEQEQVGCDKPLAFSCIYQHGQPKLKINCLVDRGENPYSAEELITRLFNCKSNSKGYSYVQPPLALYFTVFQPSLISMVQNVRPYYERLIPEFDDMYSILSLEVVKLYNKGYYLHRRLIYRSFINALNMEVRKLKCFANCLSLDETVNEDATSLARHETIADPVSLEIADSQNHYTLDDYWEDKFIELKEAMLKDMSEFEFDLIMIRINSRTIDTTTSRILDKYRKMFNPDWEPRPNARRK